MAPEDPLQSQPPIEMQCIPGGTFRMGSADFYPEERPVHEVTVYGFWMDRYAVTNEEFARFVVETGYATVAERAPKPEDFPGAPTCAITPTSGRGCPEPTGGIRRGPAVLSTGWPGTPWCTWR